MWRLNWLPTTHHTCQHHSSQPCNRASTRRRSHQGRSPATATKQLWTCDHIRAGAWASRPMNMHTLAKRTQHTSYLLGRAGAHPHQHTHITTKNTPSQPTKLTTSHTPQQGHLLPSWHAVHAPPVNAAIAQPNHCISAISYNAQRTGRVRPRRCISQSVTNQSRTPAPPKVTNRCWNWPQGPSVSEDCKTTPKPHPQRANDHAVECDQSPPDPAAPPLGVVSTWRVPGGSDLGHAAVSDSGGRFQLCDEAGG